MNDISIQDPSRLPSPDRKVLHHIWLAFAGQVFNEEKLLARHLLPLSGAEVMTAFLRLRQEGWISAVKKVWGERLYFIPSERMHLVQRAFYTPSMELKEDLTVSLMFEAKPGLALDVFNALVYISKNEGLPLTSKGILQKKHIQKLDQLEGLTNADITAMGLEYAHSDVYPPRVAVLLDLMLSLGLLIKESQALVIKADALQEWMELSLDEMNHLLFRSIMERYGRCDPESQHFRQLLCHEVLNEDIWYDVNQLLDEMITEGMVRPEHRDKLYEDGQGWTRFLAGCGWIDTGMSSDDTYTVRWKVNASHMLLDTGVKQDTPASGCLYVQPDYEVLVPPGAPFNVRFRLALCAEHITDDHMSVYRLTKASVALASDLGTTAEQVLEFITQQALTGVPDNITAALMQWGREVGRTSFADLTVLRCETAEEGDLIAAHPKLTEWIYRLGPLFFAVQPDHVSEIRKILSAAGLPPKRQSGGFEQVAGEVQSFEERELVAEGEETHSRYFSAEFNHFLFSSLVYSGRNEQYYEPDADIPDKSTLFPGMENIPVMWMRDLRTYHGTTAKQLIKQALDWKIRVELYINKVRMEFIPQRILRNPWRVYGAAYSPGKTEPEWIELGEGDWQEMRLLIPD
ncbi:helicase-associated domain-containing protein [Paenibacillus dakarensis]|uniref:helicase-associated domain-containing protein n=1 Tax=Paenibacillus dakarensis TaxID=1527293 RepID=UPI0006D52D5C|nr:helicase-associated domain-containing protein [Paenibacillus dakarensis]